MGVLPYVLLSLLTGQRKSNFLEMKWSGISLQNGEWTISGTETKNSEAITVPLCPEAVEILAERNNSRGMSNWVFANDKSKSGHRVSVEAAWRSILQRSVLHDLVDDVGAKLGWTADEVQEAKRPRYLVRGLREMKAQAGSLGIEVERAGIKALWKHDLRRTLGSWMAGSGASTAVTAKALGHKTLAMALIYQRLQIDPVRAAMETATSAIMAAGGQRPTATVHSINEAASKKKTAAA